MPRGPVPKDPAIRQRVNRAATRAVLMAEAEPRRAEPPLPGHRDWHALTQAWWRDTWRSPMASEFLGVDIHGLYLLADLIDSYWRSPSAKLAAEIHKHRQCYGLTPLDRRRLEWQVERVEAAGRRQPPPPLPAAGDDPRALLAVVG